MPTIFVDGQQRQYEKGTTFEQIVEEFQPRYQNGIALVYFNRKMRELSKKLEKDGVVSLITTKDDAGYLAYMRTATLMLVKAVADLTGTAGRADGLRVRTEFALGDAYFCTLHGKVTEQMEQLGLEQHEDGSIRVTEGAAACIQRRMEEMRDHREPILKKTYPIDDAMALFCRQGMQDKVDLFRFRRSSTVNVYSLGGYYDYFYGYMLPSAGYVQTFEILPYREGLLLNIPSRSKPGTLTPFREERRNLYEQLMLSTQWGQLVEVSTVGELNDQICRGRISDMVLVQEALQERRIGDIAKAIAERGTAKVVLVAGPSSSGKTTFANRLSIQLRSFGLRPQILSMDNWFVNREQTPVDENGEYDYECLEALDLDLFNDNMVALLNGEEIELPTYDFKSGRRRYPDAPVRIGREDVLIIEGIHGLNPRTSRSIPDENKFKIYISAMTSMNIDEHNRIPSSDTRLLRRLVRDVRFRRISAEETIALWKKVREGEEKYIFPYQENVDAVFNSVLIYEQAVLKQFAEPLLFSIPQESAEYYEAKRLLKFLDYFVGVDTASLPANSICREFIGGSCFSL